MKKAHFLSILFLLLGAPWLQAQSTFQISFRVMSYNVENLFDCQHDSLKQDQEFLPESIRGWTPLRLRKKLDDVARVIIAVGQWQPPALVGLCEVENEEVMKRLTRYSLLKRARYKYIITHSEDLRGINVALLYQPELFNPLSIESIRIKPPSKNDRPTRDILHVCGALPNKDSLDVFVVHLPSRAGGAQLTEPYRLAAVERLLTAIESLQAVRRNLQVLIMGDFNDYPSNNSLQRLQQAGLHHLLARKTKTLKRYGSYKFQGEWGLLDHLLVSPNLLDPEAPLFTSDEMADLFRAPFLLMEDERFGGQQPFRTYYGMRYQGGYSDHLPVWVEFKLRTKEETNLNK